jgi:hypothetical protein
MLFQDLERRRVSGAIAPRRGLTRDPYMRKRTDEQRALRPSPSSKARRAGLPGAFLSAEPDADDAQHRAHAKPSTAERNAVATQTSMTTAVGSNITAEGIIATRLTRASHGRPADADVRSDSAAGELLPSGAMTASGSPSRSARSGMLLESSIYPGEVQPHALRASGRVQGDGRLTADRK